MQKNPINPGFTDRLTTAAEAKKAMLAKFKPKPTVVDTRTPEQRAAEREAERESIRQARAAEKEAQRLAVLAAEEARRVALLNDEQHQLDLKRQERKDRKSQMKAEAQARKEARRATYGRSAEPEYD